MKDAPKNRILGLSPRARRLVIPVLVLAALVIVVGSVTSRRDASGSPSRPMVGDDLHAVGHLGDRLFVGGHAGASYRTTDGGWEQIDSLGNKDVMSWAATGSTLLAGGHAGLYSSADGGSTFASVPGLPLQDIHALGASGQRVYIGSPSTGTLVSNDGGKTFKPMSDAGKDFTGTIWVDSTDPDTVIALSLQLGAVKSIDGGGSWTALGSSTGSVGIAVNQTGESILVIGPNKAEQSDDGGTSWSASRVPLRASAATYTRDDDLVIAVLTSDHAEVFRSVAGQWEPLT